MSQSILLAIIDTMLVLTVSFAVVTSCIVWKHRKSAFARLW